jgi:serine/threonine protein phosphatase PrpC
VTSDPAPTAGSVPIDDPADLTPVENSPPDEQREPAPDDAADAPPLDDSGAAEGGLPGGETIESADVAVAGPECPVGANDPAPGRFGDDWPGSLAFNLPRVAGQGEDSDPICLMGPDVALVAVFDGMGGAGGTIYETPDGPRSGAYLASRVTREAVQSRLISLMNAGGLDGPAAAREAERVSLEALQLRLAELRAPVSRLRSKLLRALPTTMAMVAMERHDVPERTWTCQVLWAGDSRVYALTPSGLHQLTVDDIRDHADAMANLREDAVINNAISADTAFTVNSKAVELAEPFLIIAATDGCFGYLPSPMHFERLILATMADAQDTDDWSAALQSAISAVTGDDASMAVVAPGAGLPDLQAIFAGRLQALEQQFLRPLDASASEMEQLAAELENARGRHARIAADLWTAYKSEYNRFLPSAAFGGGSA